MKYESSRTKLRQLIEKQKLREACNLCLDLTRAHPHDNGIWAIYRHLAALFYNAGHVYDLGPYLADFSDTAAVIQELDLVISVDTAVAHLAGALGKPIWVLIPFASDWRWMLEREDSPWYPTMRLFRQPKPGDWASVIRRVAGELKALVGDKYKTV